MNFLEKALSQKQKNLTLLVVCCTAVALFHKEIAGTVMMAVCAAVGAPLVAEKWTAKDDMQGSTK